MLKKMRVKSVQKGIIISVICLVLAAAAMVFTKASVFKLFQAPVDISTLKMEEIEGKYVTAKVEFLFDSFAEMTEKNSKTNIEKSTEQYYIYPVVDQEDNVLYYAGFQVRKADYSQAEKLVKQTYDYQNGTGERPTATFTIKGGVTAMDPKVERFFKEYFQDLEASDEEINEMTVSCLVQEDMIDGMSIPFVYTLSAAALLLVLIAVFVLVYVFTGGAQRKAKKYIEAHTDSVGMERVEADCDNAIAIAKARFGNEWVFFNKGTKTYALKNDQLLWAYMHTVTTRTNGIKTGTTYSAVVYTLDKKKSEITLGSEANALSALQIMKERNPFMVIGYDENLQQWFRNDFEGFKAMALGQNVQAQPVSAEEAGAAPTTAVPEADWQQQAAAPEQASEKAPEKEPWEL